MKEKKVSVIVCTLNSGKHLREVLTYIKNTNPFEIIVVDGGSKDDTLFIAQNHGCAIVYDEGKGLGNARNIGLKSASGDYVLYVGPDNNLCGVKDYYNLIISQLIKNKWAGIGLRSMEYNDINKPIDRYLSLGSDLRWRNKIKPGECNVIGTPFLFKRTLLKKYKFNTELKASDDTELCERMRKDGLKVGYTEKVMCLDIWMGIKALINRFKLYGKSDREYFLQHYKEWGIMRRIKSILHPMSEFKMIRSWKDIKYIPFVLFIVFWRYKGYAKKY
jgi:glycosyltransferase involved in cell wall biosynthesis